MAKARKMEVIWIKGEDETVLSSTPSKVFKAVSKEVGCKAAEVEELFNLHMRGLDFEPDPDVDVTTAKILKRAFTDLGKLIKFSDKYEADTEAEAARQQAEIEKQNSGIIMASTKAHANNTLIIGQSLNTVQKVIGNKFVFGEHGLSVAEGKTISMSDIGGLIANLATASEGLDNIRASVVWGLGDAIKLARELFPEEAENIINQVIQVTGKQKHTVMESERLCLAFPEDQRIDGLTATHHQEILNYREKIPKAKLAKVIDKIKNGDSVTVVNTDGKEEVQTRPLSCAKARKVLQEAAGIVKVSPEPKTVEVAPESIVAQPEASDEVKSVASLGYLYIDAEGAVFQSKELSLKACAEIIVIDLAAMYTLEAEGAEGAQIKQLPKKWLDEKTEVEAPKKEPKKKGKKEPTPKPEPAPEEEEATIPDEDEMPA